MNPQNIESPTISHSQKSSNSKKTQKSKKQNVLKKIQEQVQNIVQECPTQYPNCTNCENIDPNCDAYARSGTCVTHPGWMTMNCGKSCKMCQFHDPSLRCHHNPHLSTNTNKPALNENRTLNDLFNNILTYYHTNKNKLNKKGKKLIKWKLKILSSPDNADQYLNDSKKLNPKKKDGPWILRFDNFVSKKEALQIIKVAGDFKRSTDVGRQDNTGHFEKIVSKSRTSKNAWCQNECWEDKTVQKVMNRISNLVQINVNNSETFQILQYMKGEYYYTHHDFIQQQLTMSCGPRILTFFLYLSDVDEGGETGFPRIGIKNKPKLGRAILWPSVLNEDVSKLDPRTYHEAITVKKGVKYAANAWFHLKDFQTPNLWSCTG